jgi:hypothetical protein
MNMSTAAQQLQHAAEYGNHAAYTAAAAVAGRFPGLQDHLSSCKQMFDHRRQAAEQALAAAVASLPLVQVQGAVDVALQLGLPGKQLAVALDAARARDAAAAARVAAAVKAATIAVQTACRLTSSISGSSCERDQPSSTCSQPGPKSTCFDVQEFDAAVAACQQLGVTVDVAAARRSIAQYREAVAAQLAAAAEHTTFAAVLEQIMQICRTFGGLEQQVAAASGKLQQQRQQLVLRLQQRVGLAAGTAGTAASSASSAGVSGGSSALVNHKDVQQLLQEAGQLGISTDVTSAIQQRLQAAQHSAATQLQEAAESGSLTSFQQAAAAARQQGVEEQQLQQAKQSMQQRRVAAAAQLATAAAAACQTAHAEASGGVLANSSSLLVWVQLALTACTAPVHDSGTCIQLSSPVFKQQHTQSSEPDAAAVATVQQLWQHAQACVQLGLASNVVVALQAVDASCKAGWHEGEAAGRRLGHPHPRQDGDWTHMQLSRPKIHLAITLVALQHSPACAGCGVQALADNSFATSNVACGLCSVLCVSLPVLSYNAVQAAVQSPAALSAWSQQLVLLRPAAAAAAVAAAAASHGAHQQLRKAGAWLLQRMCSLQTLALMLLVYQPAS